MNPKLSLLGVFSSAIIIAGASLPAFAQTRNVAGTCQPAFGAEICTWAKMSGSKVVSLGANVPLSAIEGVPADGPMVWPPVPAAVSAMPA